MLKEKQKNKLVSQMFWLKKKKNIKMSNYYFHGNESKPYSFPKNFSSKNIYQFSG